MLLRSRAGDIRTPTMILHAEDDPFIPSAPAPAYDSGKPFPHRSAGGKRRALGICGIGALSGCIRCVGCRTRAGRWGPLLGRGHISADAGDVAQDISSRKRACQRSLAGPSKRPARTSPTRVRLRSKTRVLPSTIPSLTRCLEVRTRHAFNSALGIPIPDGSVATHVNAELFFEFRQEPKQGVNRTS
jgi:hypothetical protein